MTDVLKAQIVLCLRERREQAGYTREQLDELCSLSSRFIANVEFGESSFSLDSLMTVCRVLSCSSDYLLFGTGVDHSVWAETPAKLEQLDIKYQKPLDKALQGFIEAIVAAERGSTQ